MPETELRLRDSGFGSGPPNRGQPFAAPVPREAILAELEKILASPVFTTTERLSRFLRFVVEQAVQGLGGALKEFVVGVEVFGRSRSFDPRLDAIVRVEAGRLRARLSDYYDTVGRNDPVAIELNRGSYVPSFHWRDPPVSELTATPRDEGGTAFEGAASFFRLSSIVVLPFVNLSADAENEYFSDGLTEEVIMGLTRIPGLRVIARSTAFRYKGQAQDLQKIGADLHVEAALEGSVRKTGTLLRITAQLIDVTNSFHLWSRTYEREMKDVFAIQRDISDAIGQTVMARRPDTVATPVSDCSANVEAYDLYLRAIYFEGKRSGESFAKGLENLQQAADMDPRCAPIFARLADSYTLQAAYGLQAPKIAMAKAREAAERALEIDGTLAQAYCARACVRALHDWDRDRADRDFRHALELNPGVPEIHHRYAFFYLSPTGRGQESVRHIRQARNLDPLSLVLSAAECAVRFWNCDYDGAIECGRKALELESNYYPGHMYLSWAYREKRMFAEAIEAGEQAVRLSLETPLALGGLGISYAKAGKRDQAFQVINKLKSRDYSPSTSVAYIYAGLGCVDEAFKWLEKALLDRAPALVYLKVAQWDERLRADPRFAGVVEAVRLIA